MPNGSQALREDKRALAALGQIEDLSEKEDSEDDVPITRILRRFDKNSSFGKGGETVVLRRCKASAWIAAISGRVHLTCAVIALFRQVRRGDGGVPITAIGPG